MTITIEKDVKFPGRSSNGKYPFAEMEVGDSFLVPGAKTVFTKGASLKYGFKFRARREAEGVRVWRVA